MLLVSNGSTDYGIILAEDASPSERYAAEELQRFIALISGATLPIAGDGGERRERSVLLGDSRHLRQLGIDLGIENVGDEGFFLRSMGDTLVIAGGRKRGTLYGAYTFLEDVLGCRWFSPQVSRIPRRPTIEIGPLNRREVPILSWREPRCGDIEQSGDWAARNKVYGRFPHTEEKHGGRMQWSHYVHTFYQLLPPDTYFHEHPEYYSQIDGQRTIYRAQLCLSNPEVLALVTDKVRQWIAEEPGTEVVSVSQNDWYNSCRCPDCAAIDAREGSPSGAMIAFVNQVAEAIEREYPQVAISTLAYQYTRHAPHTQRPRHNVIPHLCTIECCFAHPLTECERNASFVEDIRSWSRISDRLYVWDYVTEFGHYISPWPNLYTLQPNIKFFIENGVRGLFEQGPGTTSEFAELRTYLLAKLLWNPDLDVSATMDDFLRGTYGGAAHALRDYIDLVHDKARREHLHSHIWSPLNRALFAPDLLAEANALFDQAERDAGDEAALQRVRVARLPIQYVEIVQHRIPEDDLHDMADRFFRVAEGAGITEIREGTPLREFSKDIWTLHTTQDRYTSRKGFQ
jgi:hypothetical protein